LIDHGVLDEDDPVELLDGLLLVKEPQHSRYRTSVLLVARAVERAFGEGWFVQTQSPISLDDRSEPEPDVCVVRGSPRDYVDAHPRRPALIVEVAQLGLRLARGRKATAYARARVADYWIVNLIDRVLEVHRQPVRPGPAQRHWAHADFRRQVAQRFGGEDQGVVVHRLQIFGRLLLQLDPGVHVRRDAQAVVGAGRIGRQIAPAVGRADLEAGEAVERALEDQMRERDRGVERVADRVGEPAVALESLGQVRGALRMNEDQDPELLGLGPEGVELRIGELIAGDTRADGGAAEAELLHALDELLHRQVGELERDRREGNETIGILRAEPGERFVLDLDHLGDDVAFGPIPRRVDAERLHVDAL